MTELTAKLGLATVARRSIQLHYYLGGDNGWKQQQNAGKEGWKLEMHGLRWRKIVVILKELKFVPELWHNHWLGYVTHGSKSDHQS
jgi:hypothetical protein